MTKRSAPRRRVVGQAEAAQNSGGMSRGTMITIGVIALAVLGLGYTLFLNLREPEPIADLINLGRQDRGHDDAAELSEAVTVPAGGVHFSIWQNCGIYDDFIRTGNAVHSLEHGAVWLTYHPDLPADQIEELRDKARGVNFMLVSPFRDLESPVVASAWGVQIHAEDAYDDRIDEFIRRYRVGPQTPEPGATCGNGTGVPIQ